MTSFLLEKSISTSVPNWTNSFLKKKHALLISSKFHRACFTPPLILTKKQAEISLDIYIKEFKKLAYSLIIIFFGWIISLLIFIASLAQSSIN